MTKTEAKQNWGKIVKSDKRLERMIEFRDDDARKYWKILNAPVQGLLIGTRTFHNGVSWNEIGYGWRFSSEECIEIALIAPHYRSKPIPVPLECCKLI